MKFPAQSDKEQRQRVEEAKAWLRSEQQRAIEKAEAQVAMEEQRRITWLTCGGWAYPVFIGLRGVFICRNQD
jgi:hypothetical protein